MTAPVTSRSIAGRDEVDGTGPDGNRSVRAALRRIRPAVAIPLAVATLFYLVPLGVLVVYSFGRIENFRWVPSWNLDSYRRLFESTIYWNLLLRSLALAGIMTVVCLLIGYPFALWLAFKVSRRWSSILLLLMIIPAGTSFVVRTYSWILILGANGMVNGILGDLGVIDAPLSLAFNTFGVLVALVYIYLPWTIIPIYVSAERIDPELLEAAAVLGARGLRTLWKVIIPLTAPGIIAAVLIGFVPAISMFAVPLIIGGPSSYLFGNAIAAQYMGDSFLFGASLSVLLLVVTIGVIALLGRLGSRLGLSGMSGPR